ncbi:MAG: transglutaminase-like domain-containing protein [Muribaculaceae bacterium]|nr:transglutaminase-like domain-containing protein [Muribaculaceae bacterium]
MNKIPLSSLFLSLLGMSMTVTTASAAPQAWLEADSAQAIHRRTVADFPYTVAEVTEILRSDIPELTDSMVQDWIAKRYIETLDIDGQLRVHRKAPRNVKLLSPYFKPAPKRGARASDARISYADSVIAFCDGKLPDGGAHKVKFRFTIAVPPHQELTGDTLRAWLPLPIESDRQYGFKLLETSQPGYILTPAGVSPHCTIYFEKPASDSTSVFSYTAEYITCGQYYSPEYIEAHIQPYDKDSEDYTYYTSEEYPHIVYLPELAAEITAGETDPFKCSEMVYDYIINKFPWAGAREYSTLECIPTYVEREGHGDCGQVALLYISLMRTLGIPARWESGWMLHPGEKNLHDWAEVYFEGIGWVPVDVSFGRYTRASDPRTVNFYSTGMDSYRFATNTGVCGPLFPEKKYVRSETVDFQLGEVECSQGNLFYPAWNQNFEILEITPFTR